MSMQLFMPRPVRMRCPSCGTPSTVQVHAIVDARRQPELKEQLLHGRLNSFVCPACQHRGVVTAPLLYHDADTEFLGVFVPQNLETGEAERQKIIGELTTTLMNSLPPAERKGYLFQAKQFLTLPSLIEAILLAEGVTPEQMERQRAQVQLIDRLRAAQSNEEVLKAIVQEHDEEMDYGFFALLSSMAASASEDNRELEARQLLSLRNRLLEMTSWGSESKAEREVLARLGDVSTVDELIDRFLEVEDDEQLQSLVRLARSVMDYGFFQALTARLDAASREGKKQQARELRALRSRLLELTDELDKEARKRLERASEMLRAIMESPDPRAAVREHGDEIDDALLAVLSMNMREAERAGATQVATRLRAIWQAVVELLEEDMPAEIRLINRLLEAEFPEGTQDLLKRHRDQVNDELLAALHAIADDMERQGQSDMAKRLRDIRGQAVLLV